MSDWLVARITPGDLPTSYDAEIAAWLTTYDIPAVDCYQGFVITQATGGEYFLHVSLFVRAASGHPTVDYVTGIPSTTTKVVSLGMDWQWLPWISVAIKFQQAAKAATATFQRNADDTVTVLTAPRWTRASLELLRQADPDKLGIDGAHLNVGKLADGRDVVYRITGWDAEDNVLLLRRTEPEEDPTPSAMTTPTPSYDGLRKLAEANNVISKGGVVAPKDGLAIVGESGQE